MAAEHIAVDFYDELCDALAFSLDLVAPGDILLITGARGMDYGAKTILELLMKKKTNVKTEAISEVLDDKMDGMDDMMIVE